MRVPCYQPRYKWIRWEKNLNVNEFVNDCACLPLSIIYGLDSPDDMVHGFNTLFGECIERHAPLKRMKVTCPPAPWMNSDQIRKLQVEREKLGREAHEKNTDDSWYAFREVRNRIKSVINKSKRSFIANALSSRRPKEVWRIIHCILHPSPKPLQADPDRLNEFFTKTNERTLGTKPDERSDLIGLVHSFSEKPLPFCSSFKLRCVTKQDVDREISKLRSDMSTGVDQIPVKFVKLAKDYISGPITNIINRCTVTSSFPKLWKTARISPIPKVSEPRCDADHCPVSILPTLSKVFERLVLHQLIEYINEEALLGPTISGFRKGHSTTSVLLGIRDALIRASSRGEVTLMVCADHSKAFDTIQFKSVLTKMHNLGFSKEIPTMDD